MAQHDDMVTLGYTPGQVSRFKDLLAFHRQHFGDTRMEATDPAKPDDPKPDPAKPDDPTDPAAAPKPDPAKPDDPALGEPGKRALQAEREARARAEKEAREAKAKVKEYEDKDKSELQRLQDRAETAEREAAEHRTRHLQLKVAAEKGLPIEVADMLTGEDEAAMAAQADRLAKLRGTTDTPAGPGSVDQGATPPEKGDTAAQLKAAEAKGDRAEAFRLKNQQAVDLITKT